MQYSTLLGIIGILLMPFSIYAQNTNRLADLSLDEIKHRKDISPKQRAEVLLLKYQQLDNASDAKDRYSLAKAIAIAQYKVNDTKSVSAWINRADSLANYLEEMEYDREFELYRIAFTIVKKDMARALELLKDMKVPMETSRDTSWMVNWRLKNVRVYSQLEDRAKALKYLLEAETLNNRLKDKYYTADILESRGIIAFDQSKQEEALDYYIRSAGLFEKQHRKTNLPVLYTNICALAQPLKKEKVYLEFSEKLGQLHQERGCTTCYFTNELNKVFFLIEAGKYRKAIEMADALLIYGDSTGRNLSHAQYLKGVAYRGLKQHDLAVANIRGAYQLASEKEHYGKSSFYAHALYQTYLWQDDFAPALEWYETYISYRDSVYNEKKAKEIAVYESKLESLEHKRRVEELEARAKLDRMQNRLLWIGIVLGTILALLVLYAQTQRAQKKRSIQEGLLLQAKLKNDALVHRLELKEKELTSVVLNMTQKNTFILEINEEFRSIDLAAFEPVKQRLLRTIDRHLNDEGDWDYFLRTFKSIHSSFLDELFKLCGRLTSNEIRLASLMKMNLSSKEIANMLNITNDGVKKARYRLRKKLNLDSEVNVQDYLLSLG